MYSFQICLSVGEGCLWFSRTAFDFRGLPRSSNRPKGGLPIWRGSGQKSTVRDSSNRNDDVALCKNTRGWVLSMKRAFDARCEVSVLRANRSDHTVFAHSDEPVRRAAFSLCFRCRHVPVTLWGQVTPASDNMILLQCMCHAYIARMHAYGMYVVFFNGKYNRKLICFFWTFWKRRTSPDLALVLSLARWCLRLDFRSANRTFV